MGFFSGFLYEGGYFCFLDYRVWKREREVKEGVGDEEKDRELYISYF